MANVTWFEGGVVRIAEIFAAGYRYGAEPKFVICCAGITVGGKTVLRAFGSLTLDLVQRIGKILVESVGIVVVCFFQFPHCERIVAWIGGNGVGYCVTERKVVNYFAVFLYTQRQRKSSK